jgi:hypothetical protein
MAAAIDVIEMTVEDKLGFIRGHVAWFAPRIQVPYRAETQMNSRNRQRRHAIRVKMP